MAWVKIDDGFAEHPKLLKTGPLGMAMQVAALCYCNRNLTDGFVPRQAAARLLDLAGIGMRMWNNEMFGGGEDASWKLVVGDLVEAGVWREVKGGWQVHDYLEYQPSKADVLSEREKTKQRVSRWRERNAVTNGVSNGAGNAVSNAAPVPVPDPVPLKERVEGAQPSAAPATNGKHEPETREARGKRLNLDVLPDDWRAFCAQYRPDLKADATWQRFRDYWIAQPGAKGRKTDWLATWRNWVRNEKSPNGQPAPKRDFSSY